MEHMDPAESASKGFVIAIDKSTNDVRWATRLQGLNTKADMSGLHDAVSSLDHTAGHVHSLPAEIFLSILLQSIDFENLQATPLRQLHVLAQVCVYWWHSVRSDPRFWRDISLDEEGMVQMVLKRNPNGPLAIRCQTDGMGVDCDGFLQLAKRHSHRWQSATFRFMDERQMMELHGLDAPHLKTLRIEFDPWEDGEAAFLPKSLPQLEHLDLSYTFMPWGELLGLKYLKLASILASRLSLDQLITILSSSPTLEWLGLEAITEAFEDPRHGKASLTLPALRGLELIPRDGCDQVAKYLHHQLTAPNLYRISTQMTFEEAIRSGPNLKRLLGMPLTAAHLQIGTNCLSNGAIINIKSDRQEELGIADWASDPMTTPEIALTISGVQPEQAEWELLIRTLAIPVEKFGVTLRLHRYFPLEFSGSIVTFCNPTTRIEFNAGYPHILSALRYLSEPNIKDGIPGKEWEVPGVTQEALLNGIRDLLKRSVEVIGGDGVGHLHDGERPVPVEVTIKANAAYIEKLRGKVAEGVQLVALRTTGMLLGGSDQVALGWPHLGLPGTF